MAPFYKAVSVQHSVFNDDGVNVYQGTIDPDWVIVSNPHGGYVLALILQACIMRQASTVHPDPIHVTAHFLETTSIAPFEIRVRSLRHGRGFTNLSADLVQQDHTRITAHIIFGVLSSSSPQESAHTFTLAPPSPYARRLPLYGHPSTAVVNPNHRRTHWKFCDHIEWAWDPVLIARNAPDSATRTNETTIGGGGTEWGAWLELKDSKERITTPTLAFLVDIFTNSHMLLPRSERGRLGFSWFPTMTLSIEFKFPIPSSRDFSTRTVGLYSVGKFINEGRHDVYIEVWTAPSNIGEGKEEAGWREKQVCLAISTQMALVIPRPSALSESRAQSEVARL